jgi:HEAT repeat protein
MRRHLPTIVLGAWLLSACNRASVEDKQSAAPSASATSAAAPSYWQTSEHPGYDLVLKSELNLNGDASNGSSVKLELRGKLHLFVRSSDDGTAALGALLTDADLAGSNAEQVDLQHLSSEIQTPFLFSLESGRLGDVRVQAGLSTFAVSILRTVAAGFQFPTKPPQSGLWSAEESDATGPYVAEYKALPEPGHYSKHKVRYGGVAALKPKPFMGDHDALGAVTPSVVESTGEITLASQHLSTISYSERLEVSMLSAAATKSHSEWTLSALDLPQLDARLIRLVPGKPYANPAERADLDPARIGKLTFETTVAELEKAERERKPAQNPTAAELESKDSAREAQLFSVLGALFRQDKKNIALAVQRIERGSNVSLRLLNALVSSGAPESQPALLQVATDKKVKADTHKAAVRSMLRLHAPLPATVERLTQLLDDPDLRVNSTYVLGAMARRLREAGEGERSRSITTRLLEQLSASKDDALRIATLHSLANDGDNEALSAIRPFVVGEDSSLRMAAALALAAMTSDEAEQLLIERLETEEKTSVRSAVLDACQARRPTPKLIAATEKVALLAPDPHGRIEAARVLARWLPERPELRATLERIAKDDKEEKVRQAAEGLLGA